MKRRWKLVHPKAFRNNGVDVPWDVKFTPENYYVWYCTQLDRTEDYEFFWVKKEDFWPQPCPCYDPSIPSDNPARNCRYLKGHKGPHRSKVIRLIYACNLPGTGAAAGSYCFLETGHQGRCAFSYFEKGPHKPRVSM